MAVVLLLAARVGISPAPATARSAVPAAALDSSEQFGVNAGMMFNGGRYSRAQIDAQLASLARTGATVVRSDALWEDSEPNPPLGILRRYNWTLDDLIVSSLAQHGLRWLPIIDYSTPWARAVPGQIHSPPSSVSEFASFAAAVASRYGPGGSFWLENQGLKPLPVLTYEIWNEPDNPAFWYPSPNPAAYANLYGAARGAIQSKQAGARVIIGGLTRPAWFLADMLATDPGLRGQIDGVAIHPYGATPNRVFVGVRSARLAMNSERARGRAAVRNGGRLDHARHERPGLGHGGRAPGYISETVSTLAHSDCGIAGVMLYTWTTLDRNPANPQDWFGISPARRRSQSRHRGVHRGAAGRRGARAARRCCAPPPWRWWTPAVLPARAGPKPTPPRERVAKAAAGKKHAKRRAPVPALVQAARQVPPRGQTKRSRA